MRPKYELHMRLHSTAVPTTYEGMLGEFEIIVKEISKGKWQATIAFYPTNSTTIRTLPAKSHNSKLLALKALLTLEGVPAKIRLNQTTDQNLALIDVCKIVEFWDDIEQIRTIQNLPAKAKQIAKSSSIDILNSQLKKKNELFKASNQEPMNEALFRAKAETVQQTLHEHRINMEEEKKRYVELEAKKKLQAEERAAKRVEAGQEFAKRLQAEQEAKRKLQAEQGTKKQVNQKVSQSDTISHPPPKKVAKRKKSGGKFGWLQDHCEGRNDVPECDKSGNCAFCAAWGRSMQYRSDD